MARNTITVPYCPTLAEVTREVEQDPSNYSRDTDGTCMEPLWDLGYLAHHVHEMRRARFLGDVREVTRTGIALAWELAAGKPIGPVDVHCYDPSGGGGYSSAGIIVPVDDSIPF